MKEQNVVLKKHQVYLVDGKEVIMDDVKVHVEGEGDEKIREVFYIVREVTREGSKMVAGPAFHAERTQWIGRVISLPEAA